MLPFLLQKLQSLEEDFLTKLIPNSRLAPIDARHRNDRVNTQIYKETPERIENRRKRLVCLAFHPTGLTFGFRANMEISEKSEDEEEKCRVCKPGEYIQVSKQSYIKKD